MTFLLQPGIKELILTMSFYAFDTENYIATYDWCYELDSAFFIILLVIFFFFYIALLWFVVHVLLFDIKFNEYYMKSSGDGVFYE